MVFLENYNNSSYFFENPSNIFLNEIENLCRGFINLLYYLLSYSKYITIIILFCLGIFSILRSLNLSKINKFEYPTIQISLKRNIDVTQLISGFFLLFIGFGFITNILTLILIWILDPIPDELFYSIFNIEEIISGISPENPTNSLLQDLMKYLFGLISYIAFLQITLSIWFMASHRFHIINPNKIIFVLLTGLIEGILFGFSKCFYFMITI